MARGWESKSVEEQMLAAEKAVRTPPLSAEQVERNAKLQGLELERTRLRRELQAACNARHRGMLEQALAHVDGQIAALG
ncbi:MAG: hypothetical protein SFV54_05305 [Bryobacteraceae bacterium]|nr:hypothetical protein [Bryobacteraceae bacterium]